MIAIIICFLLGIANFAMHSAVLNSSHEFVKDTRRYFGRHFGDKASYGIEFVILLSALLFSFWGSTMAVIFYVLYSLLNSLAAWLLLSGRA